MRSAAPGALGACIVLSFGACKSNGTDETRTHPVTSVPTSSSAEKKKVTDVTAEDYEAPPLPTAQVILTDAYGGKHAVEVEVAATDPQRTRGLMWRKQLPKGKGMLFVFNYVDVHGFWMRNTLIPLDMIFIGPDDRVVGISANAAPKTLTSRSVDQPSKYVLEVPGGWSEEIGLQPGSKVEFRGLSMIPVE